MKKHRAKIEHRLDDYEDLYDHLPTFRDL